MTGFVISTDPAVPGSLPATVLVGKSVRAALLKTPPKHPPFRNNSGTDLQCSAAARSIERLVFWCSAAGGRLKTKKMAIRGCKGLS